MKMILKHKLLTFITKPHLAIQKYFKLFILKEILPIFNEDYNECWGYVDYEGKTVLDLGADYGSTAYYFLKKGAKKVIAVEGDEILARKLEVNYGEDSRVSCITKWIGNANDIEQLIKSYPCDIAKVDIEGAEIYLAEVSHKALLSVKKWFIETHTKEIYDKLTSLFLRLRFKVYVVNYDMVGVSGILLCVKISNPLRTSIPTSKMKNKSKWLDWLAAFLWLYMTSTALIGYLTNTFIPWWWCVLFVFPSIGLYCFAKWLWSK